VRKLKIFCHGVNGIPNVRRLHNTFAKDLSQIWVSFVSFISSGEAALKVTLETHFPGSKVTNEGDTVQSTRH
jgi:hypothetical protein